MFLPVISPTYIEVSAFMLAICITDKSKRSSPIIQPAYLTPPRVRFGFAQKIVQRGNRSTYA